MSSGNNPAPPNLEVIGIKYGLPVYWLEEMALHIRAGATDAEVLRKVQNPSGRAPMDARTIPLTDADCRLAIAEVRELIGEPQSA